MSKSTRFYKSEADSRLRGKPTIARCTFQHGGNKNSNKYRENTNKNK